MKAYFWLDLLFFPTPMLHSCGKYCGKPLTTHEKSPSDEGLSYPKTREPTVRFELTTCCLRNSCSTPELRRREPKNVTMDAATGTGRTRIFGEFYTLQGGKAHLVNHVPKKKHGQAISINPKLIYAKQNM